ncbi:hypothetical protein HanRHA438_Chr13g0600461 [Helianthus annuus]|nr:hypothetical protein HanRHA438_Chr13g0600461 [Helianthus annuus]
MILSSSFNPPLNSSNAAFIAGSAAHAGSMVEPMYSSSGEWFDKISKTDITLVA